MISHFTPQAWPKLILTYTEAQLLPLPTSFLPFLDQGINPKGILIRGVHIKLLLMKNPVCDTLLQDTF
jgi:hypothetical protein